MDLFALFVLSIFGLLIGSFLNVVILRFDTGKSIAKGRSVCFSCGKTLAWHELVPLVSFLAQLGRCKGCGTRISWQYPLVELSAAVAFPLAYIKALEFYAPAPVPAFLVISALLSLYIVIFVYDVRHKVIPDLFSYGAAVAALGLVAIEFRVTGAVDLARLVAGPALFLFFFSFWFASRGRWMGLGDGKLALSVGFALGLSGGAAAILLSFWIGAATSLFLMLFERIRGKRGLGLKSEIPFGPFILAGFLISFLWGVDIQSILSFLAV